MRMGKNSQPKFFAKTSAKRLNTHGAQESGRSTSGRLLPEGRKNADGLLGDAYDAVDGLIVHVHFVEDEEEDVISPFP